MNRICLSIGGPCLRDIPKSEIRASEVSKQLGKSKRCLTLQQIADTISAGFSFCPATFKNNLRKNENVEQMQLFALDFDGDKQKGTDCVLPYEEALNRAERLHIPVVMSYETKSSENWSSYRLIFLYNTPIYDVRLMKLVNYLLYYVFPESDRQCKDVARMFYPGKKVVLLSEKSFFLDELIISAQMSADSRGKNTWRNYLDTMRKETQIVTIKNAIHISAESSLADYREIEPIPIYTNRVLSQNPGKTVDFSNNTPPDAPYCGGELPIFYIFFSTQSTKPVRLEPPKIRSSEFFLKHTNQDFQSEKCRLYHEFVSGERRLSHEEWFGLCTNLIYLNNGQSEFMNTIKKFRELYSEPKRKQYQMKYAVSNGYFPTNCEKYCPYINDCVHKRTAIETMTKDLSEYTKTSENASYISIDELRNRLYSEIENAICNGKGNTIVKTQTGSGKTTAALDVIKKTGKRALFAFPNGELMKEAYYKAVNMGLNAIMAPTTDDLLTFLDDDERHYINNLYALGIDTVTEYLHTLATNNPHVDNYLRRIREVKKSECSVFLTHARLLTLGEKDVSNVTIIIDEDILPMMLQIKKSDVEHLKSALIHCENIAHIYKIQRILAQCGSESCYITGESLDVNHKESLHFAEHMCSENEKSCIVGVLKANRFYYDANENTLNFIVKNSMPNTYQQCVILSATADSFISGKLFPDCNFIELPEAKYSGRVIQNHSESFSRSFFDKDPWALFEEITQHHKNCNFITFKRFRDYIDVPDGHKMHFGKALGVNSFSGQDLVVIGTPHRPEFVYHLIAEALYMDVGKDTLAQRRLIRNGYSFFMMTFSDKLMQRIQTYLIEGELEQAVGRARLLDNNCTVFVYSRYPVKQCILAENAEQPSS